MNCSKNSEIHSKAIDFFQAWYNFVKPYKNLRGEIEDGKREIISGLNRLNLPPDHASIASKIK